MKGKGGKRNGAREKSNELDVTEPQQAAILKSTKSLASIIIQHEAVALYYKGQQVSKQCIISC